jgi:hypothetical protein
MMPVNVNPQNIIGSHAAASQIAFGAAVMSAAVGTVKSTLNTVDNVLGIAVNDEVEKTVDGFYALYDMIPIVTRGPCRAWVTSNESTKEDILAGDFLEVAILGGGAITLPIGVLQQMDAEGGTPSGAARQLRSVARAIDDATLFDTEPIAGDVAVGDTTVTMTAGNLTLLDLSIGDYILLEDLNGQAMINKVKTLTSTVIGLVIPSTVVLTSGDNDEIHHLVQVEVELL